MHTASSRAKELISRLNQVTKAKLRFLMKRGRGKATESLGTVTCLHVLGVSCLLARSREGIWGVCPGKGTLPVVHGVSRKSCQFSCGPHMTGHLCVTSASVLQHLPRRHTKAAPEGLCVLRKMREHKSLCGRDEYSCLVNKESISVL